jgi:hypothetical protein
LLLGVSKETTASVRLGRSTSSKQTSTPCGGSRLVAKQTTGLLLRLIVLATEETGASSLLSLVVVLAKETTTSTSSLCVIVTAKEATACALGRIVRSKGVVRCTGRSKPTRSIVGICVAKAKAGTSRLVLGVAKETASCGIGVRLTKAGSSRVCGAKTTCCASVSSSPEEAAAGCIRLRSVTSE